MTASSSVETCPFLRRVEAGPVIASLPGSLGASPRAWAVASVGSFGFRLFWLLCDDHALMQLFNIYWPPLSARPRAQHGGDSVDLTLDPALRELTVWQEIQTELPSLHSLLFCFICPFCLPNVYSLFEVGLMHVVPPCRDWPMRSPTSHHNATSLADVSFPLMCTVTSISA